MLLNSHMLDRESHLVFRALADENRRQILDIVKANSGISINGIADYFEFSRFAVMKHVRILENANLLKIEKDGRFKKVYLNAIPIQMIYDRWLSQYSRPWTTGLTRLKYEIEEKEKLMNHEKKQIYVLYIGTTIEKCWDALINAKLTPEWFDGMSIKFDLKVGAPLTYEMTTPDGNKMTLVKGKVLEIIPQKTLTYTFSLQVNDEVRADKESRVKYEIEQIGESVKLTVTHDQFEKETPSYMGVSQGWPRHLSNLKSYLETGKSLKLPRMH